VTVYRDGCRDVQPMALKGSSERFAGEDGSEAEETPAADPAAMLQSLTADGPELAPIKLPEIMTALRIRQMTPFGNMHVKVTVDPVSGREREVFAQLGKGGDVANSDLEAICRILSLWLRSNGSLERAMKQLSGIGSSLSVPTKDGRIMSLADGLATALNRYLKAKCEFGLEALLLGRVSPDSEMPAAPQAAAPAPAPKVTPPTAAAKAKRERELTSYKVKCPACGAGVAFEEGCVKCYSCGFSQC